MLIGCPYVFCAPATDHRATCELGMRVAPGMRPRAEPFDLSRMEPNKQTNKRTDERTNKQISCQLGPQTNKHKRDAIANNDKANLARGRRSGLKFRASLPRLRIEASGREIAVAFPVRNNKKLGARAQKPTRAKTVPSSAQFLRLH